MQKEILSSLRLQFEKAFSNYGLTIALLFIGFAVGFFFKEYVSDRHFRKQIELRFKEKDEYIKSLKIIISDRFLKIEVDKKDRTFVNRIKKYFKVK